MRCVICGGDHLVPTPYVIRGERTLDAWRCEDCGGLQMSGAQETERISRVQAIVAALEGDREGARGPQTPSKAPFSAPEAPTGASRENDAARLRARRLAKN